MKVKYSLLISLLFCINFVNGQVSLKVYPGYFTAGYYITCNSGTDNDHNAKVAVQYRMDSEPGWHDAIAPDYSIVKSPAQFRGSLFYLKTGILYHIKINYTDSFPSVVKQTLQDTFRLKKEADFKSNATVKWVSPAGSGTSYSSASPGDLKTLIQSGTLGCGMTVILKGGVYHTGEMQLNLTQDCSLDNPLQFTAADGETVILDGGDTTRYTWKKVPSDTNMYTATINADLEYNQLCLIGGERLYPYAFATPDATFTTYPCLTKLDYDLSGFYRLGNQAYIKTLDKKDPNKFTVTFSKYFYCLTVNGNKKKNNIYFRNIQFKNYAKGKVDKDIFSNPSNAYPGFGISFIDVSNVTFNHCDFEYCNSVISFNGKCSNNMITDCTFKDGMAKWSHGAFKQTRDQSIVNYGSYGRYLEYAAIMVSEGDSVFEGNCIKNSDFTGIIAGIIGEISGAKGGIKETEMVNNTVSWCYNGVNADALSVNSKIIGNNIGHCQVGMSFIGAEGGPNYIVRNIVHDINEKKNHNNDVFFMDCNNKLSGKIWGTGLKMNAAARTTDPPAMYFYHNDFHSKDTLGFPLYMWGATWKKLNFANNIFYSEGMSSLFLDGIKGDSLYKWNSNADHFYNKRGDFAIIQPVNGQLPCVTYTAPSKVPADLGADIKSTSGCSDVLINNAQKSDPMFVNANAGDFHLKSGSDDIDNGTRIPGINDDFAGSGPDIGALEYGTLSISDIRKNKALTIFPNPANHEFSIRGLGTIVDIHVYDISGKLIFSEKGNIEKIKTTCWQSGFYIVTAESGGETYTAKLLVEQNP